jgi:hypothetical protein
VSHDVAVVRRARTSKASICEDALLTADEIAVDLVRFFGAARASWCV